MAYNLQQLDEAFNKLPDKIQDYILSEEVTDSVRMVAEEYAITGANFELFALSIFALMVGQGSVDQLFTDMTQKFQISEAIADQILIELDYIVFESLDFLLDQIIPDVPGTTSSSNPVPLTKAAAEPIPSQSDVLKEVENPTPTPMKTGASNFLSNARPQATVPSNLPVMPEDHHPMITTAPTQTPTAPVNTMMDQKLSQPTFSKPQEITMGDKPEVKKPEIKPDYRGRDPYREPLE